MGPKKYTAEELSKLTDIELNLIIARDVAGHEDVRESCGELKINHYRDTLPDYVDDINAIDDLCKSKGFTWEKQVFENHTIFAAGDVTSFFVKEVFERKGEFPRCRFLCEALVLAWQEGKK